VLYVWFIVPESLSPDAMRRIADKYALDTKNDKEAKARAKADGTWSAWHHLRVVPAIFAPLAVFIPRKRGPGERGQGRDWNLTFLAISYGILMTHMAVGAINVQYTIAVFHWSAEEIGYWLTLVGFARAFHLGVILPLLTKLLKPKPPPIELAPSPLEPLLELASSDDDDDGAQARGLRPPSPTEFPLPGGPLPADVAARFDIKIARVSLLIDLLGFALLLTLSGPGGFTFATVLACFGGGFGPSAQSLSLFLTTSQENGKLFGSLAVVSALGGQVIGPAIFGTIYASTVATFPKAIFIVALSGSVASIVLVSLIRLPERGRARPSSEY